MKSAISRRTFAKGLAGTAAALGGLSIAGCSDNAASGSAASSGTTYRIGVLQLTQHSALDAANEGFIRALDESGISYEADQQNANNEQSTCTTIASTFANDGVDLILAIGTPAAQACLNATTEIPIVGTAITDFAEEIGAVAHYIFFLIPVGRGEYIQETSLEVLENETLLRGIMEKSAEVSIDVKPTCAPQFTRVAKQLGIDTRFTRGCLAGLTYCVVGSEGIVRPCAYMTEEAGDVRTQPFDEIWKTSPVFERLRTQAYSGACGTCDYKDGCGGCRARAAYYHDGDILAQDDYCAHGQQLDVHSAIAE